MFLSQETKTWLRLKMNNNIASNSRCTLCGVYEYVDAMCLLFIIAVILHRNKNYGIKVLRNLSGFRCRMSVKTKSKGHKMWIRFWIRIRFLVSKEAGIDDEYICTSYYIYEGGLSDHRIAYKLDLWIHGFAASVQKALAVIFLSSKIRYIFAFVSFYARLVWSIITHLISSAVCVDFYLAGLVDSFIHFSSL